MASEMSSVDFIAAATGRKVYDLEQPRTAGMPIHPAHKPGYLYTLYRRHEDSYAPDQHGPRTGASGMLTMMEHTGTHIDALSHQAEHLCLHGGVKLSKEVETSRGFREHGVENIAPIVRRGVLLDIARVRGVERLPERSAFTAADLEDAERTAGVKVSAGDVLLVHTGYAPAWNDEAKYLDAAGASTEATLWAAERQVVAVGADNMAWDAPDEIDPETGSTLPAHLQLLVRRGIYIIENLNLEALAADGVHTCLFICLPLKFIGATGSPVRPVAIV